MHSVRCETDTSPGDEADRAQQKIQCQLQLLKEARSQRLLAAIDTALERIGRLRRPFETSGRPRAAVCA
jgi:RNA polymerase-binding transcription factor DksA